MCWTDFELREQSHSLSTKYAHFVDRLDLERLQGCLGSPVTPFLSWLDYQFCAPVVFSSLQVFSRSSYNHICLASYRAQTVTQSWLANTILFVQQTVLSTTHSGLTKMCILWTFMHERFHLFISLLTLQCSLTTLGHIQVRNTKYCSKYQVEAL